MLESLKNADVFDSLDLEVSLIEMYAVVAISNACCFQAHSFS